MPRLAYQEIVDLIAEANPAKVASFRPSERTQERVDDLVRREKAQGLSDEERSELDHYLQVEHIMRLAKARARQYLSE